jgi:hypothetical protein
LRHRDIELDLHWNIRETKLETSFRHIPTPWHRAVEFLRNQRLQRKPRNAAKL